MDEYLKRLIIVIAFAGSVVGPAGVGRAQALLPAKIQNTLTEAASEDDNALLDAVDAAVRANPEFAQAIVDEASKLDPELKQAVFTVALVAGGDVEIATATGPVGFTPSPVAVATRPVGGTVLLAPSAVNGPSFGLAEGTITMGSAFGDGLQKALGRTRLAVFVQGADSRLDFDRILSRFGKTSNQLAVAFGGGQMSYALSESGEPGREAMAPGLAPETRLEELSFTSRLGDRSEVTFGYNTHPALGFGLYRVGTVERSTLVSTDAFAAPYLSFAEFGYNVGVATEMPGIGTLVVGSFFGEPGGEDTATSSGTMAELAVPMSRRVDVSFQLGMLVEKETILGSETGGAFDPSNGVPTYFAGITGKIALTDRFDLIGSIYSGVSYPAADPASPFNGFSPIRSRSFSLGVVGNAVFAEGDRIGFVVNQPLRVTGGKAEFALATGRDRTGTVFGQTVSLDLAADGREIDLEVFYSFGLAEGSTLTASAMLRSQPGNVASASNEGILLLRLEYAF